MKKIVVCISVIYCLFFLSGCMFSDKNQIIDPIDEYERYIIDQMDGSIRIKYATFRESESDSFTIEVNDDRTGDLSVVSEVMYYSDEFLEQNPDYILNSDYIISIGFFRHAQDNSRPSRFGVLLSFLPH